MKNIFKNWNFARWLRLAMGTAVVVFGFVSNDHFIVYMGVMLMLLTLMNASCCCAGSSCGTSGKTHAKYKDFVKPYKADKS